MGLFPFLIGQNSDNRNGVYKCLWALFLTEKFMLIDGRTLFLNFHKQQYFSANKVFQLGLIGWSLRTSIRHSFLFEVWTVTPIIIMLH